MSGNWIFTANGLQAEPFMPKYAEAQVEDLPADLTIKEWLRLCYGPKITIRADIRDIPERMRHLFHD